MLGAVGVGLLIAPTPAVPAAAAVAPVDDPTELLRPAGDVQAATRPAGDQPDDPSAPATPSTPARLIVPEADPEESIVTIVRTDEPVWWDFEGTPNRVVNAVTQQAEAEQHTNRDVEITRTYEHAFTGFALRAPRWALETIQDTSGVRLAFAESTYAVPVPGAVAPMDTAAYELENGSSLAMTGADQTSVLGDGMLISIIDTGLDTAHEAFSDTLDADTVRLSAADVDALRPELVGTDARYVNAKVPFAYDYADQDDEVTPSAMDGLWHGTHVAGIAAANGGTRIRGTAPHAQLMVQKVFDDLNGFASDSAIFAALDDAAEIRPDVVNLSLGSDAGFSAERDGLYTDIYDTLRENGVIVAAAAGNSGNAAVANKSGKNLPYATDPDYGILAAPASYEESLAVASIDNSLARPYLLGADGTHVYFASGSSANGGEVAAWSELAQGTYPYVFAGIGTGEDIERATAQLVADGGAPASTIFLIERGGEEFGSLLTFQEKLDNASAAGPVAVIFVDNVDSPTLTVPGLEYSEIPSALVSRAHGAALRASATPTLRVDSSQIDAPDTKYTVSDFTSMGVTPELQLKPDVAAPGGNIYSAMLDGQYAWQSGTSMASPQMAGILAAVKQQVTSDDSYGDLTAAQAAELAQRLVMNTALPVADPAASDALYSPRRQGAGLANVAAALSTPVSLTVTDAIDPARPSASLGDSTRGEFSFTFVAHNRSSTAQAYTIDASALSDRIADGLFQTDSIDWAGVGVEVSFDGDVTDGARLTVPANGSASVEVSIRVQQPFIDAVRDAANGTFVDGFVRLHSDDAPALTVPYLGFFGDWSAVPVFDAGYVTGEEHIYGNVLVNASSGMPMGVNPLDTAAADLSLVDPSVIDPERYVASPTRYSISTNRFQMATGLLRNVDELTYELVRDADETVVGSYDYSQVVKSLYNPYIGQVSYAEARLNPAPVFAAYGSDDVELRPGGYRLVQTATTSGPGSSEQSVSTALSYDNTGARIENVALSGEGEDATLEVTLSDDTWIASVDLQEYSGAGYFHRTLATDPTRTEDGRHVYDMSIPISAIQQSWTDVEQSLGRDRALPSTAMLYVWDYGLNLAKPLSITLFESPVTGVKIAQSDVQLAPTQRVQLDATVEPSNAPRTEIAWASSDDSVVTVDAKGFAVGVAAGTATLTATAAGTEFAASVDVQVADISEDAGLEVTPGSLVLAELAQSHLQALLAPSLTGRTVTWSTSDADVVDVDTEGTVSGVGRGEAEVTATVQRPTGDTVSATVSISVQQPDFADYVIEDGVLIGYRGTLGVLDVPEGVREIADYAFAETDYTSVKLPASLQKIGTGAFQAMPALQKMQVVGGDDDATRSRLTTVGADAFKDTLPLRIANLPDSVTDMGTSVFENTRLQSFDFPAGMTSVPAGTFRGTIFLKDVTLHEGITEIGVQAFVSTSALTSIALPESLHTVGDGAFASSGLTSVTLPDATTVVGRIAFSGVPLRAVDLGNVESVGVQSFADTRLRDIVLPDTLVEVGVGAFAYNTQLETATIGANVAAGSLTAVFSGNGSGAANPRMTSFIVPDSAQNYRARDGILYDKSGTVLVTYPNAKLTGGTLTVLEETERIDDYALLGSNARAISLPEGLHTVGENALASTQLETFTAPESLTTIERHAFASNSRLRSIVLPKVQTIGDYAFAIDNVLRDIDLGSALTSIGNYAFQENSALTQFVVPDTVTTVGDAAFINSVNLRSIHFGSAVETIGTNALTGITGLTELTVSAENAHFYTDENVFYGREADGLHLKLYLPAKSDAEYSVVDGTVAIDPQAFRGNRSIARVVLPEGLRTLGTGAFNDTSALSEVVLPDSLETVNGFYFNSSLRTLEFGTNIRTFGSFWSMGTDLQHLVVRGGHGAAFADAFRSGEAPFSTAYFGPGMTSLTFTNEAPDVLVVPADLQTLSIARWADTAGTVVYAVPGSDGWTNAAAGIVAAGLAADRLREYTPLNVALAVSKGADDAVGAVAQGAGGVLEVAGSTQTYEYRYHATSVEGASDVVQDWSADGEFEGSLAEGSALSVEVRDATLLTSTADWTGEQSAPVVLESPSNLSVTAGQDAVFTARASGDPEPTVQWQARAGDREWTDIPDAAATTLTVASAGLELSGTQYRAVFTNPSGTVFSAAATLTVSEKPTDPTDPEVPGEDAAPEGAPGAPELTADNRGTSHIESIDGLNYTVWVGAEYAQKWIGVTLHSDPVFLGWTRVDARGVVSVTVPEGTTGAHHLSFVDRDGIAVGWVPFAIAAGETPGETPGGTGGGVGAQPATPDDVAGAASGPGAGRDALAATGSPQHPLGLTLLGLAGLLGAGAIMLTIGRRRGFAS